MLNKIAYVKINTVCYTLCFFFVALTSAFSTPQIPDIIIYEDTVFELQLSPIIRYFELHPERKFRKTDFNSTALYRGYTVDYEIIEDKLFITSINVSIKTEEPSKEFMFGKFEHINVLSEAYPGKEKVFLDWFSGVIVLHDRNINVSKFDLINMECILLEFQKGVLVKTSYIKHKDFPYYEEKQFEKFMKSEAFKSLYREVYSEDFVNSQSRDIYSLVWNFKNKHITFMLTIE